MGTLAAGIKEIFATAKTTGSNVMLCGNDGTPDGHMTMANLASALGIKVGRHYASSESVDFNDLVQAGAIKLDSIGAPDNKTNAPQDGWGCCLSVKMTSGQQGQIFINDSKMMQVRYKDNEQPWTAWKQLSTAAFLNSYTSLSDLANALGESITINNLDDWDNLTTGGRFFVKVLGAAHSPNPNNWFHVIVISAGIYKRQIAFIDNNNVMYVRGVYGSEWTQWREI